MNIKNGDSFDHKIDYFISLSLCFLHSSKLCVSLEINFSGACSRFCNILLKATFHYHMKYNNKIILLYIQDNQETII